MDNAMDNADLVKFETGNHRHVVHTQNALWYTPSSTGWSIFPYRVYPSVGAADFDQLWRPRRVAALARTVSLPSGDDTANRVLYVRAEHGDDIDTLSSNSGAKSGAGSR